MRFWTTLLLLSLFFSCQLQTKKEKEEKTNESTKIVGGHSDMRIIINGILYEVASINDRFYMLREGNDTIIPPEEFYYLMEIMDINKDGYQDIRVFVMSNSPNQCENYFFNPTSKTFDKIKGADLDISYIKEIDRYYTIIAKCGCASNNNCSEFGKIENKEFIQLGFIQLNNCDEIENDTKIYKEQHSKSTLIDSMKTADFIGFETYWLENHKKFE